MKQFPRSAAGVVTVALAVALLGSQPASAARPSAPTADTTARTSSAPSVFTGTMSREQLGLLDTLGLDRHEDVRTAPGPDGRLNVEIVMSAEDAAALARSGAVLTEKRVSGTPVRALLARETARTTKIFRPWSGAGGLRAEFLAYAADHPDLVKVESVGRSVRGQDILAFKVTAAARSTPDGSRPAVLYASAQHAREWITPEMTRRLMRYVVDGYATDASVRSLLRSTELWFLPVANPDGYDYSFTEGNRLWRKNLRDNDGDGKITSVDGVDPNRNFEQDWGYDDEGSSPNPSDETYRGPRGGSEPETVAFDTLLRKGKFKFSLNYHSAAELLLYGSGKQVATPEPDDTVFETLLGDRRNPAVPGYDPDRSSEIYTTNGTSDEHAHYRYGTLMVTPEISTCETASAVDPNDAFEPGDCASGFSFPDSEPLINAEFRKNLPLALAMARSARTPDRPESVVGRVAPDFQPDTFSVSYGDPQTVAVTARRSLTELTARWRVNKGPARSAPLRQWRGGERYGQGGTNYYAEFRATVRGASVGDSVTVWFTGRERSGSATRSSKPFTYRLVADSPAPVLVLADEDITGDNPTYPVGTKGPRYAGAYTNALKRAGYASVVYDIDRYGAPHPLGVLGHFRAVVWYLGDNRLTQDERNTNTAFGPPQPDVAVAQRAADTTYAVRDFLNEGGKLVYTGETASYYGADPDAGGLFYGQDEDPSTPCLLVPDVDCRLLSDDFSQYYLGAWSRAAIKGPKTMTTSRLLGSTTARFGGPALTANPLDEAGGFAPTSSQLSSRRPLFSSSLVAVYQGGNNPFGPARGRWALGLAHANSTYARVSRTFDLKGVAARAKPTLRAQLSVDTQQGTDNVLIEARTPGKNNWTTLPDLGGATSPEATTCTPDSVRLPHPALANYLTGSEPCATSGKTGKWNSITGSTGWVQTRFDLSAYAGQSVEISITYVSDQAGGGVGVLVDDVALLVGGKPRAADSATFETGTDGWAVTPSPADSPPPGARFTRTVGLLAAGVRTEDTVLLGFGVEQLATLDDRAKVLGSALRSIMR